VSRFAFTLTAQSSGQRPPRQSTCILPATQATPRVRPDPRSQSVHGGPRSDSSLGGSRRRDQRVCHPATGRSYTLHTGKEVLRKDNIDCEIPRVVRQLEERPQYLFKYLRALFDKDPQLCFSYSDKMVSVRGVSSSHTDCVVGHIRFRPAPSISTRQQLL